MGSVRVVISRQHERAALRAKRIAFASAIAGLWLVPASGSAHDSPHVLRVLWAGDEHSVALLTNRGLIFGDPSTRQWQLMCNEALHLNTLAKPDVAYVPDGRLWVTTYRGLRSTADHGCTWQGVDPFGTTWTTALVQDPATPTTLYIGTYGAGQGAVRMTKDAGATWTALLMVADDDFIQELRIAPSKHDRLYVSGEVLDMQGHYTHYVGRSDDGGKTWERNDSAALLESESDLVLMAVSPSDPDLLLARAQASDPMTMQDRILVSRDGGKNFDSAGSFTSVFDGGFSADGSNAWIAGTQGLLHSTDGAKTFAPLAGVEKMTCIFERDSKVFGCGRYASGQDGVGTSSDEGTSFSSWMAFTDVTEPVQCDAATETAATCAPLWRDWEREIFGIWDAGMPSSSDKTGTGDASVALDAGMATTPMTRLDSGTVEPGDAATHQRSGGCTVRQAASEGIRANGMREWALLLAGLALLRRRRAP